MKYVNQTFKKHTHISVAIYECYFFYVTASVLIGVKADRAGSRKSLIYFFRILLSLFRWLILKKSMNVQR